MSLLIELLQGTISEAEFKQRFSILMVEYTTSLSYIEDKDAELKSKKVKFLHSRIIELIDEFEKLE